MPASRRYSLEEVKRGYTAEKAWGELQGDFFCWLLYRPLSFPLSAALLNLRVPILAVTGFSGAVALAMFGFALAGGPRSYLGICLLAFLYPILDCADGNMARTLRTPTHLGGIVDGTIDMAYQCLLLVSVGLTVSHGGGGLFGAHAITASLSASVLLLLNRQTRDNYTAHFADVTYFTRTPPEHLRLADYLKMALLGLEHGYVFAILAGGAFGVLDWVLLAILVYVTLISIGAIALTFARAARADSERNDPEH